LTDKDFPPDNRSLYKNIAKIPEWARDIRTIKWLRPHEIVKDAKFIVDKEADLK